MQERFSVSPLGDGALLVSFGNIINEETNAKVMQLFQQLKGCFPFVKDIVPAYSSLTIYYDVVSLYTKEKSAFEKMKEAILPLLQSENSTASVSEREIAIPVCYAKKYAIDLEELAAQKQLPLEEIIRLHTGKTYRVYMIGFLPGFPYMGKVDERIATPRRSSPRTGIAAGSVGIAGEQTGIYPFNSPGGWKIIGRTPVQLFDKNRKEPVLLQPGDQVSFISITEHEFENYQSRIA